MDCKKFEDLILDYFEGDLENHLKIEFSSHLDQCPKCQGLYENYQSMRSILDSADQISPGDDVLKSIRSYAKQNLSKEKPPFYKRWFYSPILVPAFATAMALIFVINYGQDYLNDKTVLKEEPRDVYDQSEAVSRNSAEENRTDSAKKDVRGDVVESSESKVFDEAQESGKRVFSEGKPLERVAESFDDITKDKASIPQTKQGPSSDVKTENETGMEKVKVKVKGGGVRYHPADLKDEKADVDSLEEDMFTKGDFGKNTGKKSEVGKSVREESVMDLRSQPGFDRQKEDVGSAHAPVSKVPEENSYYRRQLNQVTLLQYQGNCVDSIKEADKLLNSDPKPPISIQKNAYTSQAECYEEIKDFRNAIEAYKKLQTIDSENSDVITRKINQLNMKVSE